MSIRQRADDARLGESLRLIGILVALLWIIELVDWVAPGTPLDWFGVHPRSWIGLRNVLLAPFLHVGFGHLAANTIPFAVLGLLVLLQVGASGFAVVSLAATLASGLGVWVFGGSNTVHLGASGVIFGYFGFLVAAAWWERSARALLIALAVILVYGGMILGVLPGQPGISWLAHLFGLLGGLAGAWLLRRRL